MVFSWNAVQDLGGYRLRQIEVSCGYHKGGSSQIFAKFSHHYGTHHANVYFLATVGGIVPCIPNQSILQDFISQNIWRNIIIGNTKE